MEKIIIQDKTYHKRAQIDQGSQGWGWKSFMEEEAFEVDIE